MTLRELFIGADARPHPPLRIVLFLVLFVACLIVVTLGLGPVLESIERISGVSGAASAYGATLALLLAHWMTLRTFDQQPWSFVWMHKAAARPRLLTYGWLLGAVPIGIASLALVGVGLLAVMPSPPGSWLLTAVQTLVLLVPAAFYEELLSRGYVFATLGQWLGWRWAVLLTSVAFGLLHVGNPGATPVSIALVTLAGVYLAAILLATGSLYAVWMGHWAWNWIMAAALHVSVSGLPLSRPDYQIVDAGPDWITGGQWGPEGGVAAAAAMIGGLAFLRKRVLGSGSWALGSQRHLSGTLSPELTTQGPEPKAQSNDQR